MKTILRTICGCSLLWAGACLADYSGHSELQGFVDKMHKEHAFDKQALTRLFAEVERKDRILEAIARPAEKVLTWAEYQDIFIQDRRIDGGVQFWRENQADLQRAYETYGVAPEVIVSIIGVETRYGENTGSYRVIDALATLGFDYPPRSSFFRKELEHFLVLAREQKRDPLSLKGSYAGAMGYGQFMPSSYRAYAVDFDGDGFTDIWSNPADAIGSVANYLARHGWQKDQPVVSRARIDNEYDRNVLTAGLKLDHKVTSLKKAGFSPVEKLGDSKDAMAFKLEGKQGAEFWIGLKNFEVITRYNRSQLYAMAVYQLAERIRQAHD
ncbi:lytic murein transglycosylase B [Proteobacteria bacterium 005FR1]|nr:lytic murein transglycosylase B [Proteobacteria bacterium 005FR1]